MVDLDLLYYAGYHARNQNLIDIATVHARTVLKSIVRENYSTFHLVNFDPKTGEIKDKLTNQGYQDWSTWSRGQAWAILGFTQTYIWTKDPTFLNAAISLAKYFLSRLEASPHSHPFVPLWDFDAPPSSTAAPLRDTSAGMITANGLLLLHQILHGDSPFLAAALRIVKETRDLSLSPNKAKFETKAEHHRYMVVDEGDARFDGILMNSTANNNEHAFQRYWDHGLVYADYYLLEFGNKLLRMGFV